MLSRVGNGTKRRRAANQGGITAQHRQIIWGEIGDEN
jgi:hypothetical protein